jgi:hypothetical protein
VGGACDASKLTCCCCSIPYWFLVVGSLMFWATGRFPPYLHFPVAGMNPSLSLFASWFLSLLGVLRGKSLKRCMCSRHFQHLNGMCS